MFHASKYEIEKNISHNLIQENASLHRSQQGAGRKITCDDLEEHLSKRENRLRVSRNMIKLEAEKWMKENQPSIIFNKNDGWLQKGLRRNRFTLRKSTTVSQKIPDDCVTKVVLNDDVGGIE